MDRAGSRLGARVRPKPRMAGCVPARAIAIPPQPEQSASPPRSSQQAQARVQRLWPFLRLNTDRPPRRSRPSSRRGRPQRLRPDAHTTHRSRTAGPLTTRPICTPQFAHLHAQCCGRGVLWLMPCPNWRKGHTRAVLLKPVEAWSGSGHSDRGVMWLTITEQTQIQTSSSYLRNVDVGKKLRPYPGIYYVATVVATLQPNRRISFRRQIVYQTFQNILIISSEKCKSSSRAKGYVIQLSILPDSEGQDACRHNHTV
jgi:hypothetical protein